MTTSSFIARRKLQSIFTGIGILTIMMLASPTFDQTLVAGRSVLGGEVDVVAVAATGHPANKLVGAAGHNDKDEDVGSVNDLFVASDGNVTLTIFSGYKEGARRNR